MVLMVSSLLLRHLQERTEMNSHQELTNLFVYILHRRKELVKDIKKKGEGAKVAIRNIRRDANDAIKKMEKNGDISEDELKDNEDKIQKLTDKYVGQIDKAVESKSKEIMTV